jgi:acetyltransferase
MNISAETLPATPPSRDLADLSALLQDAIEGGASVGFMLPVRASEMEAFWAGVFLEVRAGSRIVLATRDDTGRIVGSAQLALAGKPNSRHRAELQKLLVLRTARGRGIGCALGHAAEAAARTHGRNLIVLDTSATGNAIGVYTRCGYTRAGVIPRYANDPDGPLIDTVFYYKELSPAEGGNSSANHTRARTNGQTFAAESQPDALRTTPPFGDRTA